MDGEDNFSDGSCLALVISFGLGLDIKWSIWVLELMVQRLIPEKFHQATCC